ncbi:MAG: TonB-dependent receptor [Candidatus Omnitrophica bacterium]|nr:TonB-dependent receptor [Candidatus Omnitrophota bacterium]
MRTTDAYNGKLVSILAALVWAATGNLCLAADEPQMMKEVRVLAVKEEEPAAKGPFLPDVQGTRIHQGKKTTSTALGDLPPIQNNNYRQAFNQMPGLLISEQQTPGHVNMNYRGVGDPHETGFLLTTKDGIPVLSDWFGYSTAYYAPPLEAVERVELVRGGGALLYGPQPGPVLNYVTPMPPSEEEGRLASTRHTMGSYGLYSTHNTLGRSSGPMGFLGYFNHRQANGPRENADFEVFDGDLKTVLQADPASRWILDLTTYSSESGEPGRLTQAQFDANRDLPRTPNDRIWIERHVPTLTFEHELSPDTLVAVKSWGGYQDRFSRRQSGTRTNLDRQEFTFFGTDARLRRLWEGWGNTHALTGGFVVYTSDSPRCRESGPTPQAASGPQQFSMDRSTNYGALFLENLLKFGPLGVIPAFRLETVSMSAEENFNVGVNRALQSDSYTDVVPLGGLGLTFEVTPKNTLYANASQAYKPKSYDDLVNPTSATQRPPSNLEESQVWNYEAGVRGNPLPWLAYDTSLFFIDYDNYMETRTLTGGNVERQNSGRAEFKGWEGWAEADLIGLWDALAGTTHGARWGRLGLSAGISKLDAEFVSGANDGREPAYAPSTMLKSGLTYQLPGRAKVSLTNQFVADHFWQDSNAAGAVGTDKVDSYKVWDFAAEFNVYKDTVALFFGANNLFNEDYYSRVRSDGIEPAYERNLYAGVTIRS